MELRICGTEKELASFIMFLSKAEAIAPSVKAEIKASNKGSSKKVVPKTVTDKVNTKYLVDKYKVSGQTIRNYTRRGMPYIKDGDAFLFDEKIVDEWIKNYQSNHISKNRGKVIKKHTCIVNESDYASWKSELTEMIRKANKDEGKMLSLTFKYMNKNYGIVWDQEKKDFQKENGYVSKSTTRVAYWLEQTRPAYKNLTASCLATVLKEVN